MIMNNPTQKQHKQSLLNADNAGGFSGAVDEQSTSINLSDSTDEHDDHEQMPLSANMNDVAAVITIEEAQQLVWELPKIAEQDKTD